MLLLLISLFSNVHCNEAGQDYFKTQLSAQMQRSVRKIDTLLRDFQQEIQKQKSVLRTVDLEDNLKDVRLLDFSITPMWGGGTFGVDKIGQKKPTLLHWMTKSSKDTSQHTKNLWENLNLLPIIQLNSSAGPLDDVSGELSDHPDYSLDQELYTFPSPPSLCLLDSNCSPSVTYPYNFYTTRNSSYFTRPVYPFSVPPYLPRDPYPRPVPREGLDERYLPGSPSTWIDLLRPTRPPNDTDTPTIAAAATTPSSDTITRVSTLSASPPLSLPGLREPFTYNPKSSTMFKFFTKKVRTNYTQNKRITKANRITSITHWPRQIERTLSKAQAWVRNRQWTKTSKAGRTRAGRIKEVLRTSVTELLPPADYMARTETAFTGELLQEDGQGFLYVTIPASITEYASRPPTSAGDVLIHALNFTRPSSVAHPNKKYYDLMEEWDEGYMMAFLLQLTRLVSMKRENEVREVLYHAEFIMNGFYETGEIAWAGERIMNIAMRICGFCSESGTHNMGVLRSYAGMFHQMLKERDTALSVETNSIIDYADLMYEDDEGEALFEAVREFEEYPNTYVKKTSREICLNLIVTFLLPYKRLKTTARCQRLLDSVNKILNQRFGGRRANGELLMLGGTATTKPTHSRETQRIHNSLKRRISIKRLLINRTKHHDSNEDTYRRQITQAVEYPMLRSVLPITRHQKRFRVITPRQLRSNVYLNYGRPTKEYFYKRRLGKPIHPLNGMLEFFPQATKESEIKRRIQPSEVTHHHKESVSLKTPGRIKAELIRRITDETSYSDEEAMLKVKLRVQNVPPATSGTLEYLAYTNSSPLKTPQEDKKGTNLAWEVVLQLHLNENSKNVFLATNKTVIDDNKIPRPDFRAPRIETFTDFIQGVANILNNYEDTAFKDFFDILDEEIRKYHYRGCKFYELTENYEFRSLMAEKLDMIKRKPVPVLKADINELVYMIRDETYDKNVKELLDYTNSLYREDAREKFRKVLSDLNAYGNSTSKRHKNYLVNIIRNGVRAIIFDHYTDLNINVRRELKREIATFLNKMKESPSSSPKFNLFPYKPAVRESEDTVKISGYNIATEDKNTTHNSKRDPTSTADNINIRKLKANDEKHGEEATKLKTSKDETHSQQMQLTYYVSTAESSADETVEGNSIELTQEHQESKQSYATLFMEEISGKPSEHPEIIFKSELKSELVQKMLIETTTDRLPLSTVQPTTTPGLRRETTSNEDTDVDPVILIKAISSRDVSNEDLRRSIAPPLPEEELSIDVFDREERKRQKSLAKHNITTVQHGIKDYIKRMRNLQNKVNQLKKINEYNQNSRMNVISNGDKIKKKQQNRKTINNKKAKDTKHKDKNKRKVSKKIIKTKHVSERQSDEYEARTQTEISNNKDGKTKRDDKRTNSVNEDVKDLESNKEKVKKHGKHADKLKKQKTVTRSKSTNATEAHKTYKGTTGAVTSVNIRVRRCLKPLPTATNDACNTTDNDNNKTSTKTASTITKKVGNATLNVTEEVKSKIINNTANDNYVTKDSPTRRYRRVLEFSSPPLYDQPFFDDHIFRKGL